MRERVKPGQIVKHRITGQKMIVVMILDNKARGNYTCRYQLVDGKYTTDDFFDFELIELNS